MEEQSVASPLPPKISTGLMTVSRLQESYSRLFPSVAQLFGHLKRWNLTSQLNCIMQRGNNGIQSSSI